MGEAWWSSGGERGQEPGNKGGREIYRDRRREGENQAGMNGEILQHGIISIENTLRRGMNQCQKGQRAGGLITAACNSALPCLCHCEMFPWAISIAYNQRLL